MSRSQCLGAATDGGRCPFNAAKGKEHCRPHTPPRVPRVIVNPSGPAAEVGAADAVVYYLGDPDTQLVKIGTTKKLRTRVRKIRDRGRPRVLLLATEPGWYALERLRHKEYARWNVDLGTGEREWFTKAPLLMRHITETRYRHGILCPGWPIEFALIAPVRRHLAAA